MDDESRVAELHRLLAEARALQDNANRVIVEITNQLQRSIWTHDDRGVRKSDLTERRRKRR